MYLFFKLFLNVKCFLFLKCIYIYIYIINKKDFLVGIYQTHEMFFHLIFFPLLKKFWVGKDLIIIIIMMMMVMIRKDKPRVGHLFIWKWLIKKF